jgi:Zn-dependent M28 family amino/carboxypeptidase
MKIALVLLFLLVFLAVAAAVSVALMTRMPERSHRGPLPPLTAAQGATAALLRGHVEALSAAGPRILDAPEELEAAAAYIERSFAAAGCRTRRQTFVVDGVRCANIEGEIPGTSGANELVIVGAHYDSVDEGPGADDNASGVAALLEISRRFAGRRPARTIRLVAFVNEEPPYFKTEDMGSWRYAEELQQKHANVAAMLSLEAIGYFADGDGTQQYPPPLSALYPSRGDFIALVGNLASLPLVRRCSATFRRHTPFPSEGAALPELIAAVGWSDQWSFWRHGWKALMISDTALFRNPHYHRPSDLPDTLDYDRMARVVDGIEAVVADLTER